MRSKMTTFCAAVRRLSSETSSPSSVNPLFGLALDFFVHLMLGWRKSAKRVSSLNMKIKLSFHTSIEFAVSYFVSVHVRMPWRHTNREQSKLLHVFNNKSLCWKYVTRWHMNGKSFRYVCEFGGHWQFVNSHSSQFSPAYRRNMALIQIHIAATTPVKRWSLYHSNHKQLCFQL